LTDRFPRSHVIAYGANPCCRPIAMAFKLHPGDERIGPDASLPLVRKGKRTYVTDTYSSQVNLPVHAPTLIKAPLRRTPTTREQALSSDTHLWRSYDSAIRGTNLDNAAREGQEGFRRGLRDRISQIEAQAVRLREEQIRERTKLMSTHESRRGSELAWFRERCRSRGMEGLQKPTLRTPEPTKALDQAEVESMLFMLREKERLKGSRRETSELRPFGPPTGAVTPTLARWTEKSLM
jgi:hypothetical protein